MLMNKLLKRNPSMGGGVYMIKSFTVDELLDV